MEPWLVEQLALTGVLVVLWGAGALGALTLSIRLRARTRASLERRYGIDIDVGHRGSWSIRPESLARLGESRTRVVVTVFGAELAASLAPWLGFFLAAALVAGIASLIFGEPL